MPLQLLVLLKHRKSSTFGQCLYPSAIWCCPSEVLVELNWTGVIIPISGQHYCQRPYHAERTGSRPITEVKQRRASSVLGWVTAWEHGVLLALNFFSHFFGLVTLIFLIMQIHCFLIPHSEPENLKKSRPKKLVKSNKSISRKIFLTKFHFLQFQKWPKINFWTGKKFKTAKNAISRKLIYIMRLHIRRPFLL